MAASKKYNRFDNYLLKGKLRRKGFEWWRYIFTGINRAYRLGKCRQNYSVTLWGSLWCKYRQTVPGRCARYPDISFEKGENNRC